MHINTKFNDANLNENKTEKEKKLRNFFLYISRQKPKRIAKDKKGRKKVEPSKMPDDKTLIMF